MNQLNKPTVLVVDDDDIIRKVITHVLMLEGYAVTEYNPVSSSAALLEKQYDVAVIDIVMPGTNGFTIREKIAAYSPLTQFIIITGFPEREKLDKAMDLGVFTFLVKPFTNDHIRYAVFGALRMREMFRKNLEHDILLGSESMGLVGNSTQIQSIRRQILEIASLSVPVLITGESGTGKEIVASCVHRYSQRAAKSFIAVNCAGFTATLMESELFGHVQGAFTGAVKTKFGFFEAANGGTIFLDEIGEMPFELQSKLLRVLDKGEYNRVGDAGMHTVNVRVISATNQNLEAMVAAGKFRKDLYYRLKGTHISIPPLRERVKDIPALARHFLGNDFILTPDALDVVQSFSWPGNVRELSMVLASLKGLTVNKLITAEHVRRLLGNKAAPEPPEQYQEAKNRAVNEFDIEYFNSLMIKAENNISKASEISGMYRKNLRDKLKTLGMYTKDSEIED